MALKLTFSKVSILSFSRKSTSGSIKLSCAPSKAVSKQMGWGEVPEWETSSVAAGKLTASLIEFTPADSALSKAAFDLEGAGAVRDFEFVRTEIKKGKTAQKVKATKLALLCSVDFTDPTGARKIELYMQTAGECSMRVTFEREAEQEDLPMLDDERAQATLEVN